MCKVVKYGNVLEDTQIVYTGNLKACRYKLSMIKNEYSRKGWATIRVNKDCLDVIDRIGKGIYTYAVRK
jgi:hypothetical protein